MCRVVNKYKEPYDIYIGRGSIWGNPYSHLDGTKALYKVPTREESIEMYRSHLWSEIKSNRIKVEDLIALDGKTLGCFCKPKSCHGDIIALAVKWAISKSK